MWACCRKPLGSLGSVVSSARMAWYAARSLLISEPVKVEAGRRGWRERQSDPHADGDEVFPGGAQLCPRSSWGAPMGRSRAAASMPMRDRNSRRESLRSFDVIKVTLLSWWIVASMTLL